MTVFVDCLIKKEFEKLATAGKPTIEELNAAWLHLYSEYLERVQDSQIESFIERRQQIDALTSRLARLQDLLQMATNMACAEFAAIFKAEGFTLDADAPTEVYQQQLRVINARLLPDSLKLDRLLNEQETKQERSEVTHATFIRMFWDISKQEGYRIKIEDVTVGEYCDAYLRLRDYREAQRQAMNRA